MKSKQTVHYIKNQTVSYLLPAQYDLIISQLKSANKYIKLKF